MIGSVAVGICFARFNEMTKAPSGSAVRFRRTRNIVGQNDGDEEEDEE